MTHSDPLSQKKLTLLARLLQKQGIDSSRLPLSPIARDGDSLPLSYGQEQLWVLQRLEPESPAYNVQVTLPVPTAIGAVATATLLQGIVDRHETLRSYFPEVNGRPVHRVADAVIVAVEDVDLTAVPAAEQQSAFAQVSRATVRAPFDLLAGPVFRAALVRLPDRHVLLLALHHIVTDGWSTGVLVQEFRARLEAILNGRAATLPPLTVQYQDYAAWQRAWLHEARLAELIEHWTRRLDGVTPTELLPDRARPLAPTGDGAIESTFVSSDLTRALRDVSRRAGVSLFTTLVSAFNAFLHGSTGQSDIVIGMPVANRERPEVQPLIGFFVNMLPLRTTVDGRRSFLDLVEEVQRNTAEALAHQELPFERLAAALGGDRDLRRNPVFQIVFNLLDDRTAVRGGAEVSSEFAPTSQTTRFDLEAHVLETAGGLRVSFAYSTDLFEPTTARRLLAHYVDIVARIASNPESLVDDLLSPSSDERTRVVHEWNRTARPYPRDASIADLLNAQVAASPEATAVVWKSETLTYAQLNRRANQVAHGLRRRGVGLDSRVAVSLERGIDQLAVLVGIVKAGAAYVAIDPSEPAQRAAMLLNDAGVTVAIGQSHSTAMQLAKAPVTLDDLRGEADANITAAVPSDALAYVAFTSGSTGRPKGVEVTHRAVVRLVRSAEYIRLAPQDVILQLAPVSFDASTLEIWGGLLNGARLVVYPDRVPVPHELGQTVRESGITTMWLTASLFNAVIDDAPGALAGVQQLLVGGEALSVPHVRRALSALPGTTLINGYGPTENTTFTCCYRIPAELPASIVSIPLGAPIANTQVYVLDPNGRPVPVGVPGELYVGGDGLARGYAGAARLTAERFVPDGISGATGARLYRTGDVVRWTSAGILEFIGRRDEQIKLRGFRIELGEIEAALASTIGVRTAAAAVRGTGAERRLIGYVVAQPGVDIDPIAVRASVQQVLPPYMVPSVIAAIGELPLTLSGKIDRRALPDPEDTLPSVASVPPRTSIEVVLARIWSEVLRRDVVGVHDNFFELGGDSILSIQIVSRAIDAGLRLKPKHLFLHPTIAELAHVAVNTTLSTVETEPAQGVVPLTPVQHWLLDDDPVDVHHFNQALMLAAPAAVDTDRLARTIEALVVNHDMLRARFRRDTSGWTQEIAAVVTREVFERIDVSHVDPAAQSRVLLEHCTRVQQGFSLEHGPLFRAVLFDGGPCSRPRLFLAAHHLVIDAVSWRIVVDDLRTVYAALEQGVEPRLRRTTSYLAWAHALQLRAETLPRAEREFWTEAADRRYAARQPHIVPSLQTDRITVSLPAEETSALLREAGRSLDARVDEIVLSAVIAAFHGARFDSDLGDGTELCVELEGHGRDDEADGFDLSRTVAWFTAIYPASFDVDAVSDPVAALDSVKRVVRRIPHGGIGWGLLRYLGPPDVRERLARAGDPPVSFNYLGQLDVLAGGSSTFSAVTDPTGPAHSPRLRRRHLVDVVSVVADGCLHVDWSYDSTRYQHGDVAAIAARMLESLRALIARTRRPANDSSAGASWLDEALVDVVAVERLRQTYPDLEDVHPVTPTQHGMLFHTLLHPDDGVYSELYTCRLEGRFDLATFRTAWAQLIERHGVLRSVFTWNDVPTPVQIVRRTMQPEWTLADWRGLSATEQAREIAALQQREASHSFDLGAGPLLRFAVAQLADDAVHFVWTFHHILLDGWSLAVISRELGEIYEALLEQRPARVDTPPPYRSYVEWRRTQSHAAATAYWRRVLGDVDSPTPLGVDRPRRAGESTVSASEVTVHLDASEMRGITAAARARAVTLHTMLIGAWSIVLSRYANRSDVVIGTTVSGRPADLSGSSGIVGLFINTVPVRVAVSESDDLPTWLQRLQAMQLEQQDHQYFPLIDIARCSGLSHDEPLFESVLVFENYPAERHANTRRALTVIAPQARHRSNYPLVLVASAGGDRLLLRAIYDERRFDQAVIERLLSHVTAALRILASHDVRRLRDIPSFDEAERTRLLHAWNPPPSPGAASTHTNLVSWFEAQADRHATSVAVTASGKALTYAQLNARANQLAGVLRAMSVGPESAVAVCLDRSVDLVVAVIAILKTGAAYVPVDPSYPDDRIRFILEDAGITSVITETVLHDRVRNSSSSTIYLDAAGSELAACSPDNLGLAVDADSRAYVIYTSGSTGTPNGVEVTHGQVVRLFERALTIFDFRPADVWTLLHAIGLDLSVWELWGALLHGSRLVVVPRWVSESPDTLLGLLLDEGVTVLNHTPSAFRQFAEAALSARPAPGMRLRYVLLGGEPLDLRLLRPWAERYGVDHPRLVAMYGITEATVHVTHRRLSIDDVRHGASVVGQPIADMALYLLDGQMEPVPLWVRGEIYVGGAGVARGYLNRPRLTAEHFVPDPFGRVPGGRLYRTGDFGRRLESGEIEYLGRIDQQVRLRGFRIELGEIESVIRRHPVVRDAVILAVAAEEETRLVAYVVPDPESAGPLRRLVAWERDGRLDHRSWCDLPNGMAVVQLNRNETDFLYQQIFVGERYLRHGVSLGPGACVFDVGANIGMFSLYVLHECPDARVFAFEPIPQLCELLEINAELHGLDVRAFASGLSDCVGEATFSYRPDALAGSPRSADRDEQRALVGPFPRNPSAEAATRLSIEGQQERVGVQRPVTTVSHMMKTHGVDRIDLLKIDAEQTGLAVLEGVDADDWPKIRQVVAEVHGEGGRLERATDVLARHGFQVAIEQDDDRAGTDAYRVYAVRTVGIAQSLPPVPVRWSSPTRFASELRDQLSRTLPDYMVPASFVVLDRFPLTANGKLDRRGLPAAAASRRAPIPPQSDTERHVAAIWQDVLGVDSIARDDDFFELGGHSLLATRAVVRLREAFAIELPLVVLFDASTLAALAAEIDRRSASIRATADAPVVPVARTGNLVLSPAQQRLWFLDQLEPGRATYNVPAGLRIDGMLDILALERAFSSIVHRHEVLRTTFAVRDGEPVQVINEASPFTFERVDLRRLDSVAQAVEVDRLATAEALTPFDLARGPLVRGRLLVLREDASVLLLTLHHIVCDAWSMQVLVRELTVGYNAEIAGERPQLPPLPVQYADYAAWQRAWLDGPRIARQLDYWATQLAALPTLELPTDRPRPATQTSNGSYVKRLLPRALSQAVEQLAQDEKTTLFATGLTAFTILMSRYTGQTDIAVGTPVGHRPSKQLEPLIGFFSNMLVLRTSLAGAQSFRENLHRVRGVTVDAYAHQDVPFEQLVDRLQPERHLDRHPLFQVLFTVLHGSGDRTELAGLTLQPIEIEQLNARFDLEVHMAETSEGLLTAFYFNTDLFNRETIARMAAHFEALLERIVADPDLAIDALDLLPAREAARIERWNATARPVRRTTLSMLVEEQATRTPDRIALEFNQTRLTFRELNARANQLARYLRSKGVRPDDRVAIAIDRSIDVMASVLGVVKAGAAYLPLDVSYPAERLHYMLADSGARVLLTTAQRVAAFAGRTTDATIVCVDRDQDAIAACSVANPSLVADPDNLAYVLYTSGSTGRPKGVALSHQALINLLFWQIAVSEGRTAGRTLQYAPLSFDPSFLEMFSAWCTGGTLVLVEEDVRRDFMALVRYLDAHAIERLYITPAALHQLADASESSGVIPRALREINAAGERLEITPQIRRMCDAIGGCALFNQYGPTESHVCTAERVIGHPSEWPGQPTIGTALPNTRIHLFDRAGRQVPVGIPGELYIAGDCLARGYIDNPRLTADRFVPDPSAANPGGRLYRTGDLARFQPDGSIDYLGRTDHQVKLRGYRIEPGEIEAVLAQHRDVLAAVALVRESSTGVRRLVAYIVAREGTNPNVDHVRTHVAGLLPEYMVPSRVDVLDALPMTPSGKIDRGALLALAADAESEHEYAAPRNAVEDVLVAIWSESLGADRIGIHDNFFAAGGHSLLAAQVISRVRRHWGIELPIRLLFEAPTIAGLGERLQTLLWAAQASSLDGIGAGSGREEGAL